MGRLIAFNFTTLNGFFKEPHDDISWNQYNRCNLSSPATGYLKAGRYC